MDRHNQPSPDYTGYAIFAVFRSFSKLRCQELLRMEDEIDQLHKDLRELEASNRQSDEEDLAPFHRGGLGASYRPRIEEIISLRQNLLRRLTEFSRFLFYM
jgi:hypothetical protein